MGGRRHSVHSISTRTLCQERGGLWEGLGATREGDGNGFRVAAGGGDASTLLRRPWLPPLLTVQLSLPPSLYLEGLPRKYVAAQLHLHWGQKGSPGGSEHQIDSEAAAAEVPGRSAAAGSDGHGRCRGKKGPRHWEKSYLRDNANLWDSFRACWRWRRWWPGSAPSGGGRGDSSMPSSRSCTSYTTIPSPITP